MLPLVRVGERGPLLVMLHWLGGDARSWEDVSRGLAERGMQCAAVNLPGFGAANTVAGYSVAAMADAVADTVRALRHADMQPWFLAGHSMGGKVAAVVARRSLDGEAGLEGLRGLVLVSASPPGPEPMTDAKRTQMMTSLGESTGKVETDRLRAGEFVDSNTGKLELPEAVRERAIDGVVEMSRTAFRAWLDGGSKEDWAERVRTLELPALVCAGTEDEALGPAAQRKHTLPHLPHAELVVLEAAGHLGPMERAGDLVERVTQFVANLGVVLPVAQPELGATFAHLLASDRVSPETRQVMEARVADAQTWSDAPKFCGAAEIRTLRALVARVVPHAGFDVAASLDAQLAKNAGDGWRFAELPADTDAWRRGLLSLDAAATRAHGVDFAALFPEQQDTLLQEASAGSLRRGMLGSLGVGDGADAFNAAAMQQWFEDVRARCAQTFIADPRGMERIGFTGFADDMGFTQIALGQREEFEH